MVFLIDKTVLFRLILIKNNLMFGIIFDKVAAAIVSSVLHYISSDFENVDRKLVGKEKKSVEN